jgi:Glycosyltransferase family 87
MGVVIGIITAILWMHRSGSGSDAYAYWYGVHVWLDGGDPYRLQVAALPWHYPPWMLPIFLPWALLPWSFAWPVWRVITIVPLMLTAHWAFERRPMATARAATMLAVPIGIALDTGNVILLCALALWIAQFSRPRRAALLWTVVTAIKWFPVVFWFVLSPSARRWALVLGAVALVLALVTWHWTVEQVVSISLTGVPHSDSILALRLDHLAIAWAAIPWLWRRGLSWAQERWGSAGEPVRQKLRRAGPAQIG